MDIQRKISAWSPNGFNANNKKPTYVNLPIDNRILEMMCKMLVTDNKNVRRSQLINLQNYINNLDPQSYLNDQTKMKLISFIKKGLEARLVFNLSDPYLVMKHINGGILDDSIVDIETFTGLGGSEVNWLNNTISESLKFSHIFNSVDRLIDICTRFKVQDYSSKSNIAKEFEMEINDIQNNFRRSRNESHTEVMFSLAEGDFQDAIYDTYNQLASPRRKLITGMQGMNELLGGGFECGRCYVFFGLPGVA